MLQLLLVSLIWAFSFGLVKHHLHGVDGTLVAAARAALALAVFLPLLRFAAAPRAQIPRLMGIGAIQFGLMYLAYLSAFATLQAYQVALLALTTPVLVCIFDDALERRFRFQPFLAALAAVGGSIVIVAQKPLGHAEWRGIVLMQIANVCFAVGQVLFRRWKLAHPAIRDHQVFAWPYLGALLATAPIALWRVDFATLHLTPANLGVLVYLGVIASGLGFFLWTRGAAQVSAATMGVMNNAKTPLAVLVSLVVFGEQTDFVRLALGGGIIAAAAWWAERSSKKN